VLNVQPLPASGQPAGFNGTVGDYIVTAQPDRTQLTTDDLVTLKVAVQGFGAIELANPPAFPNGDFELAGQDRSVEKVTGSVDQFGGTAAFELVLRPTRSGTLTIPAIRYPVFNPRRQSYETLETKPVALSVSPGARPIATPAPPPSANGDDPAPAADQPLNYLKTITRIETRRPAPLIENPLLWLGELAFAALAGMMAWRRRRRIQLDPARIRRRNAWSQFTRRLKAARVSAADPQALAAAVENAARQFIADHFNCSPEGLTRQRIEALLAEAALPGEKVRECCDLLDRFAAVRYAPGAAAADDLRGSGETLARIFREGLVR
jgi:hypothetical protein